MSRLLLMLLLLVPLQESESPEPAQLAASTCDRIWGHF